MRQLPLFTLCVILATCNAESRAGSPAPVPPNLHEVERQHIGSVGPIIVVHDDTRHVTCWVVSDTPFVAMSCLPDVSFMPLPME
jgi:hypothetical protein